MNISYTVNIALTPLVYKNTAQCTFVYLMISNWAKLTTHFLRVLLYWVLRLSFWWWNDKIRAQIQKGNIYVTVIQSNIQLTELTAKKKMFWVGPHKIKLWNAVKQVCMEHSSTLYALTHDWSDLPIEFDQVKCQRLIK